MEKLAKSASKVMPGTAPNHPDLITKFGYASESGDRGREGGDPTAETGQGQGTTQPGSGSGTTWSPPCWLTSSSTWRTSGTTRTSSSTSGMKRSKVSLSVIVFAIAVYSARFVILLGLQQMAPVNINSRKQKVVASKAIAVPACCLGVGGPEGEPYFWWQY